MSRRSGARGAVGPGEVYGRSDPIRSPPPRAEIAARRSRPPVTQDSTEAAVSSEPEKWIGQAQLPVTLYDEDGRWPGSPPAPDVDPSDRDAAPDDRPILFRTASAPTRRCWAPVADPGGDWCA